jgi:hypothetical protein
MYTIGERTAWRHGKGREKISRLTHTPHTTQCLRNVDSVEDGEWAEKQGR